MSKIADGCNLRKKFGSQVEMKTSRKSESYKT